MAEQLRTMKTWLAPAKINLFLHIIGRRTDGYHLLQSVMQPINFCDELQFSVRDDGQIHLSSNYQEVEPADNLVYRAAKVLQDYAHVNLGVDIYLQKNIPVGAGLGGGSSDAATTLQALNVLWGLQLPTATLAQIGLTLGADVPFFVFGEAAWVEGIGEKITAIELPSAWYLLVLPACHVSTKKLYADERLTRNCPVITIDDYRPGDGVNVFTEIVRQDYPAVAEALDWLGQFAEARMTGSGAVVYARFDTEAEAGRIAAQAPHSIQCVVSEGLKKSPTYWGVAKR